MDTIVSEEKNIFLLTNKIEKEVPKLLIEESGFNFYPAPLDDLSKELKNINNMERENNLIIISKEFINDKVLETVRKLFLTKLKVFNPHLLFISKIEYSIKEQDKIIRNQNFFYHIPPPNSKQSESTSFYFFLKMIFQRMKDISRLDNYIVNAFQTIIDSKIINKQKQEIEKLYDELDALSKMDYLTKILNRKAFFEAMDAERSRTLRSLSKIKKMKKNKEKPKDKNLLNEYGKYACIMIDLDHFKEVNDTHGHLTGDQVLKILGELLKSKSIFRDNDIIGRYGGEEFIIVLPDTNASHAKLPAERLRNEIKGIDFKGANSEIFNVSISIGISEFRPSDKSNDDLIERADRALYYAKQHDRDQTIIFEKVYKG